MTSKLIVQLLIFAWFLMPELALTEASLDVEALKHICQRELCRPPLTIRLRDKNGRMFESSFDVENPIVRKGWISIFPGETVFVEAERKGMRLVNLRAVKAVRDPSKTLEFKFWQDKGKADMFLKINNPFSKTVKYHAVMMLLDSDKLYKTSSCPVVAGKTVFERWPHAIFELLLFDFQLLETDAGRLVCEF